MPRISASCDASATIHGNLYSGQIWPQFRPTNSASVSVMRILLYALILVVTAAGSAQAQFRIGIGGGQRATTPIAVLAFGADSRAPAHPTRPRADRPPAPECAGRGRAARYTAFGCAHEPMERIFCWAERRGGAERRAPQPRKQQKRKEKGRGSGRNSA